MSEDALHRSVQLGGVDLLAPNVELRPVLLHEQSDVLPVPRRQVHVLNGNHLLLVLGGENHIQGVSLPVGNNLENGARTVQFLYGKEASSCPLELLEVQQQEEPPLLVDGIDEVPEGVLGYRGDQVWVEDLVGGAVWIVALHEGDPMVFLGDLDQFKQVVHTVIVPTLCGGNDYTQ